MIFHNVVTSVGSRLGERSESFTAKQETDSKLSVLKGCMPAKATSSIVPSGSEWEEKSSSLDILDSGRKFDAFEFKTARIRWKTRAAGMTASSSAMSIMASVWLCFPVQWVIMRLQTIRRITRFLDLIASNGSPPHPPNMSSSGGSALLTDDSGPDSFDVTSGEMELIFLLKIWSASMS